MPLNVKVIFFIILLICGLGISPLSGFSRKPPEPSYVPGQVILKFHDTVDSARSAGIVGLEGCRIKTVLKRTGLHIVLLPEGRSVEEALERFRKYPEVLWAEPDYRAQRLEDQ